MRKQGSGYIVDIISGIAFSPMAYQTMYAAEADNLILCLFSALRAVNLKAGKT